MERCLCQRTQICCTIFSRALPRCPSLTCYLPLLSFCSISHITPTSARPTMAALLVNALRGLFFALGSLMVATLVYTVSTDGLPFRMDILTPYSLSLCPVSLCVSGFPFIFFPCEYEQLLIFRWMGALLVDFYINIAALAVCSNFGESS